MIRCCRCWYEHEYQIVDHIKEAHEPLVDYLEIFGGEAVVSPKLKTALENLETVGHLSAEPGLHEISDADRKTLVDHWQKHHAYRSEIIVEFEPEF